MLASDDPHTYRHPTNALEGQANNPLDLPASRWMKGRIRLVRDGIRTHVIPEAYVERGDRAVDPATGVPRPDEGGAWVQLCDRRKRRPMEAIVLTGLPGGEGRLQRAIRVWKALFHARAIIPLLVEESAPPRPD